MGFIPNPVGYRHLLDVCLCLIVWIEFHSDAKRSVCVHLVVFITFTRDALEIYRDNLVCVTHIAFSMLPLGDGLTRTAGPICERSNNLRIFL